LLDKSMSETVTRCPRPYGIALPSSVAAKRADTGSVWRDQLIAQLVGQNGAHVVPAEVATRRCDGHLQLDGLRLAIEQRPR